MKNNFYKLSPLAEADLEEIWLYTRREWSLAQANKYYHHLVAAFEGLAAGNIIGRICDIRANYLKYSVGSHMIYYRLQDDSIVIMRILHGKMDVNRHL